MTRRCTACGGSFRAKGSWQRKCWECWRAEKDRTRTGDYGAGYAAAYRQGVADGAVRAGGRRELELDQDRIKALIALCHPDRHGGPQWELANKVTGWLLDQRRAL